MVQSKVGNILWDCVPLLDEMTIEFIKAKGGLRAIAFSHPHFYSNMNDWQEPSNVPYIFTQMMRSILVRKANVFNCGMEMNLICGME